MRASASLLAGHFEEAAGFHLFAKVSLVEYTAQYALMNLLQLCHRKFGRQKLQGHCHILQLLSQALQGTLQDLAVIACQHRQIRQRKKSGVGRVAAGPKLEFLTRNQRVVRDSDDALPRVAVRAPEGAKLLQ